MAEQPVPLGKEAVPVVPAKCSLQNANCQQLFLLSTCFLLHFSCRNPTYLCIPMYHCISMSVYVYVCFFIDFISFISLTVLFHQVRAHSWQVGLHFGPYPSSHISHPACSLHLPTNDSYLLSIYLAGCQFVVQPLFAGHYYSEALYDRTADFDNISFLEAQPDEALRKDCRAFASDRLQRATFERSNHKFLVLCFQRFRAHG